jgi:cob(I)alamin adenosyltransferase
MVVLNRIYTKTGDDGTTALGSGERVAKTHPRIAAYGTIDEANAAIGVARLHLASMPQLDAMLGRIQNDLFDVGADLCVPDTNKDLGYTPLRMSMAQAGRVEREIDELNGELEPLRSFVIPGGHPGAAYLHLARTVTRRAERCIVELKAMEGEKVSEAVLVFVNRLSDFLFVASRWVNARHGGDVLWVKGENR